MSNTTTRWGFALIGAAIAYIVLINVLPRVEASILSPKLLVLSSTLLATAAGVGIGALLAPRERIRFARRALFLIALLVSLGETAWGYTHGHPITTAYLFMWVGTLAGGVLGIFIALAPKPARQPQPRSFG